MTLQTYTSVRASCMYTLTVEVFLWILKTHRYPPQFWVSNKVYEVQKPVCPKALQHKPGTYPKPGPATSLCFGFLLFFWVGFVLGRPRVKKYLNHGSSERMAAADLDGRASTDGSREYPQVRHRIAFLQVLRGSDIPANTREKINGWEHN